MMGSAQDPKDTEMLVVAPASGKKTFDFTQPPAAWLAMSVEVKSGLWLAVGVCSCDVKYAGA